MVENDAKICCGMVLVSKLLLRSTTTGPEDGEGKDSEKSSEGIEPLKRLPDIINSNETRTFRAARAVVKVESESFFDEITSFHRRL